MCSELLGYVRTPATEPVMAGEEAGGAGEAKVEAGDSGAGG